MNNKQLVSLFFGLGFLVLVAGIFATTQPTPRNNNSGVEPQMINRTTTQNNPNAVNENMPTTNQTADKIKTELRKVNGVTNVDASVVGNSALISCTVNDQMRQQANFKETLTKKVKEIDPALVNVYVMESQDGLDMDFGEMTKKFTNTATYEFNSFWENLMNGKSSN